MAALIFKHICDTGNSKLLCTIRSLANFYNRKYLILKEIIDLLRFKYLYSSVRPNTEYSAEYSAKMGRIFGTEYSAKLADTPIPKKRRKFANFCRFLHKFDHFSLKIYFTFV